MKNSSQFISDSVYKVNLNYVRLQNKSKELFFKCLDENRDLEYFKKKLEELWGSIDYTYTRDEIEEYNTMIHEQNLQGKEITKEIPKGEEGSLFTLVPISVVKDVNDKFQKVKERSLFTLVPISVVKDVNDKFQRVKEREYKNSLNSYAYENDKQEYLKLKVSQYNNQVVPYYSKKTGKIVRYVQPSTYNSMIHNTNLTRSGWNTTLNDADIVGINYFWIPYHSFSCPHCLEHQNRMMSKEEVIDLIGIAEEAEGDILHPNCKCSLNMFYGASEFNKPKYSYGELDEQYQIRQKVNTLTLRKEELLADIRIQKSLGNQDEVDKLNKQRNKINKNIKKLQEALPTTELKKQVVAINR